MATPNPMLAKFASLDRKLVAAGFPETSAWWRGTIRAFYRSGKRQLVARVGRRGGKSSTLCRFAVCEALFGGHAIPPGDVGVVAFISVSRDEATQRLRTIRSILDALGVQHKPIESGIELEGKPIAFKVYAASVAGVSGFTAIAVIADEVAKWRDADTGANPAREVLASLRPTMATQRKARMILSSSPFGTRDAHAMAFAAGNNSRQIVAHAPTWIANPTISEEQTHDDEPDEKVWSREYAAIPGADVDAAFAPELVARAVRDVHVERAGAPLLLLDASAGRGDSYTWAAARHVLEGGRELVQVYGIGALDGIFRERMTADQIHDRVAEVARSVGATEIHGDAFESFARESAFRLRKLRYIVHDWTNASKVDAIAKVREWLRDDSLVIEPGVEAERLRREMLAFQERISASGFLTYGARRGGHDDRVALLLNLAMADLDRKLAPVIRRQTGPVGLVRPHVTIDRREIGDALGGRDLDGRHASTAGYYGPDLAGFLAHNVVGPALGPRS